MELEAQWWTGQLAADIHQALRYKELKLPSYKGQSPQLHLRRYFADLIAIVSNRFRLCPAARHLAVYLLDLFMDRYDISIQQLHVVALSCLLLARFYSLSSGKGRQHLKRTAVDFSQEDTCCDKFSWETVFC